MTFLGAERKTLHTLLLHDGAQPTMSAPHGTMRYSVPTEHLGPLTGAWELPRPDVNVSSLADIELMQSSCSPVRPRRAGPWNQTPAGCGIRGWNASGEDPRHPQQFAESPTFNVNVPSGRCTGTFCGLNPSCGTPSPLGSSSSQFSPAPLGGRNTSLGSAPIPLFFPPASTSDCGNHPAMGRHMSQSPVPSGSSRGSSPTPDGTKRDYGSLRSSDAMIASGPRKESTAMQIPAGFPVGPLPGDEFTVYTPGGQVDQNSAHGQVMEWCKAQGFGASKFRPREGNAKRGRQQGALLPPPTACSPIDRYRR